MGFTIMELITKANTDIRGISLLEVIWKVVEAVIDTLIKTVVQFHDVFHGFLAGREAGTAIMELKPAQELENMDHYPLLSVLIFLIKSYTNLY